MRAPQANNAGQSIRLSSARSPNVATERWTTVLQSSYEELCRTAYGDERLLSANELGGVFAVVSTSIDEEREAATQRPDVIGRLEYGVGGAAMAPVEFDWLHGIQFAVPSAYVRLLARIDDDDAITPNFNARLSANIAWQATRPAFGGHSMRRSFELTLASSASSALIRIPNKADSWWLTRRNATVPLPMLVQETYTDTNRSGASSANPGSSNPTAIPSRARYWSVTNNDANQLSFTVIFGLQL